MGSRFQVNVQTEGDQVGPQVHPLNDGGFVVVWRGPPGDSPFLAVYAREYDGRGDPAGPEIRLDGIRTRGPSVDTLDRSLVVAFDSDDGAALSIFDLDGAVRQRLPIGEALLSIGIHVASMRNDEIILAWDDGRGTPTHAMRYRSDGTPAGPAFVVDDALAEYPHAPVIGAAPHGSYILAWWAEYGCAIYGRKYDRNDVPGERFLVVDAIGDSLCE